MSSVASRTAHAPTAAPRCHAEPARTHSVGTTGPARRPGRPESRLRLEPLAGHLKPSSARRQNVFTSGQAKPAPGVSVRHVEVFQMGSVRTPIFGTPRRLSGDRRAQPLL